MVLETVGVGIFVAGSHRTATTAAATVARLAPIIGIEHFVRTAMHMSPARTGHAIIRHTHGNVTASGTGVAAGIDTQVPHPRVQLRDLAVGVGDRADLAVLAAALDALVAILVQIGKVLPELLVR